MTTYMLISLHVDIRSKYPLLAAMCLRKMLAACLDPARALEWHHDSFGLQCAQPCHQHHGTLMLRVHFCILCRRYQNAALHGIEQDLVTLYLIELCPSKIYVNIPWCKLLYPLDHLQPQHHFVCIHQMGRRDLA